MNLYVFGAGCLAIILGLIHSVFGEVLIFHPMRKGSFIPSSKGTGLKARHVKILWASWHLVTVFGLGFGAILLQLALHSSAYNIQETVEMAIMLSMFTASITVLVGTKGKHPGWVILLGITILLWIG